MFVTTWLVTAVLAAKSPERADPPPAPDRKVELALQLIEITRMDQLIKGMDGQIRAMMRQQLASTVGCDAAREQVDKIGDTIAGIVTAELEPEKMRTDVAAVYAESFSADELAELIDFYQSPLGEKMLDKMPVVMQKTLALNQARMQSLMPKMRDAMASHRQDIESIAKLCPKSADGE